MYAKPAARSSLMTSFKAKVATFNRKALALLQEMIDSNIRTYDEVYKAMAAQREDRARRDR